VKWVGGWALGEGLQQPNTRIHFQFFGFGFFFLGALKEMFYAAGTTTARATKIFLTLGNVGQQL